MGLIINGIADLTAERQDTAKIEAFKQRDYITQAHNKFKVGQIIEFWGGYNNDIRYRAEIFAFDKDGEIYVLWDCFWFPIKDETKRDIKLFK